MRKFKINNKNLLIFILKKTLLIHYYYTHTTQKHTIYLNVFVEIFKTKKKN